MAEITVTNNVADAASLGGEWQRFITITNTSTATELKLSRDVGFVDVQPDQNDLMVAVDGAAGVALDSAAFLLDADDILEVQPIHPPRSVNTPVRQAGSIFFQATNNPTVVRLRARKRGA